VLAEIFCRRPNPFAFACVTRDICRQNDVSRINRGTVQMAPDDLEIWIKQSYLRSYRTACLILGNPADAEEAVQEAFLRAWRFRASIAGSGDIRPWLYRVVVNTCNSKLRQEIPHRDRRTSDEGLVDVSFIEDAPARVALGQDMQRALQDLPPALRVVVVLRYYAELSEREIATVIGRRPGTVKSRLHEARRLLGVHPALHRESVVSETDDSGVPG
jgi:RNA polymerase sigma-70 factor, ECF subfamily